MRDMVAHRDPQALSLDGARPCTSLPTAAMSVRDRTAGAAPPVSSLAMARDRSAVLGTLCALVAASLFGMLGPLARFGAEAGIDGVAFTAWRAYLGVAFLALLVVVRGGVGTSVAALQGLPRAGRLALATAGLTGVMLNLAMFTAFGLIPIALALMLFYTYPAGVVVVDLVLGRERLSVARLVALALSFAGVVFVLVGGLGGASGESIAPVGILLGLAA